MIGIAERSLIRAASPKRLAESVRYIADPNHPHHLNKDLLLPRNFGCPGQSAEAFIGEVIKANIDYWDYRTGKAGKNTRRLFEELIYSSEPGANYTPLEREEIEARLLALIGRYTPARGAWHIDRDTGRADYHLLFAAKNRDFPPAVVLWSRFGHSKKHVEAEFIRVDQDIVEWINSRRPPESRVKSRRRRQQENAEAAIGKKPTLAAEIAANTQKPITAENIRQAIESLGYTVRGKPTAKILSVVFASGEAASKKRPRRFHLARLLTQIMEAQRLRRKLREGPAQMNRPNQPGPEAAPRYP